MSSEIRATIKMNIVTSDPAPSPAMNMIASAITVTIFVWFGEWHPCYNVALFIFNPIVECVPKSIYVATETVCNIGFYFCSNHYSNKKRVPKVRQPLAHWNPPCHRLCVWE